MKSPDRCMHSDPLRVYYGRTRKEALPMEKPVKPTPLFKTPKTRKRMDKAPVQH